MTLAVGSPGRWRFLQLADSAFPTGGFAHSAGLETAVALGRAGTPALLEQFVQDVLWNAGTASLPFVGAAYRAPESVWEIDRETDAFLSNPVANRASRTQGRAFIATCARIFDAPAVGALAGRARERETTAHLAPLFGACLASFEFDACDVFSLYLYWTLRGVTSAAVRLGIVGPHEAQRLLHRHGPTLDAVLVASSDRGPEDAATTAPVLDIVSSTHDRLYARLFQS